MSERAAPMRLDRRLEAREGPADFESFLPGPTTRLFG